MWLLVAMQVHAAFCTYDTHSIHTCDCGQTGPLACLGPSFSCSACKCQANGGYGCIDAQARAEWRWTKCGAAYELGH